VPKAITPPAPQPAAQAPQPPVAPPPPAPPEPPVVRGQQLREVPMSRQIQQLAWTYGALIGLVLVAGIGWQAWRTRREKRFPASPGVPA